MKTETTHLVKPIFRFLTGDVNWLDYGGKWISQRQNNGDFDFWYVIELINMDDACWRENEGMPKYSVSLAVVSPHEAGEENIRKAMECHGYTKEDNPEWMTKPECLVEILHGYGVSAHSAEYQGNNAIKLIQQAKDKAKEMSGFTIGFSLDRAVNAIGTTGWEALKGDITAGLHRTIESGTTEGKILAKIYGISVN